LYLHKKLGYHKENYLKLVKFTKLLIRINLYDKSEIQAFEEKVKQEESLLLKSWFLEQISKMK